MPQFIMTRDDGSKWSPVAGGYVKDGRIVSTKAEWTSGGSGSSGAQSGRVATTSSGGSVQDKRQKEMINFAGWSSNPDVQDRQRKSWEIYVSTGRWDTNEQKSLHREAEAIRKMFNPNYQGSLVGTINQNEDQSIFGDMFLFFKRNTPTAVEAVGQEIGKNIDYAVGKYDTNGVIGIVASLFFVGFIIKLFK